MSSLPASSPPPADIRSDTKGRRPHRRTARAADPEDPSAPPAAAAPPPDATQPPAAPVPPALVRIPYRDWKGPRPRAVGLSSALIVLAGIISLISGVATARSPVPELSATAVQLGKLGIDVTGFAAVFKTLALATALVVFGLYLLFAFLIRDGRNWARIGGTALAGPALVAAFVHGEALQVFAVLAAAAGLGLLYRSDCNRYFRPRQAQYRADAGP